MNHLAAQSKQFLSHAIKTATEIDPGVEGKKRCREVSTGEQYGNDREWLAFSFFFGLPVEPKSNLAHLPYAEVPSDEDRHTAYIPKPFLKCNRPRKPRVSRSRSRNVVMPLASSSFWTATTDKRSTLL